MKNKKLPKGIIRQDLRKGVKVDMTCPNCKNGFINGQVCIACRGDGVRPQHTG